MNIPKCKECEFYENTKRREHYYSFKTTDNFCHGFKTTDNEGYDIEEIKFIYVKDLKTSPSWCPKRIKL